MADQKDIFPKTKKKKANALLWLYEPLESDPRFLLQKFFFMDAAYLDGKLYFGLVDRGEPWNGVMVCTSREHHDPLVADFPQLTPHAVLGKWLYLSLSHPEFEATAQELVSLAAKRDSRLGVETGKRKKSAAKKAAKRS